MLALEMEETEKVCPRRGQVSASLVLQTCPNAELKERLRLQDANDRTVAEKVTHYCPSSLSYKSQDIPPSRLGKRRGRCRKALSTEDQRESPEHEALWCI